ncbi:MAG: DUF6427 family protein [Solitalea-like symbiont of Tyrophagus putrescentiae]
MIIRTFLKSEVYNLIFLLLTIVLLRFPEFFKPEHLTYYTLNDTFREHFFYSISSLLPQKLDITLSSIILIIQALFLGYVFKKHVLINKLAYMPEFLFIVIGCSLTSFAYLSPPLICNFLFIIGLDILFSCSKSDKQLRKLFYLGLLGSLGSVLYLPYIFMIPAFIFSLYVIKSVRIKEIISILMGSSVPYIFLLTIYIWFDKAFLFSKIWLDIDFDIPQKYNADNNDFYAALTILAPILIISLSQLSIVSKKRSYMNAKNLFSTLIVFVVAILSGFIFLDFNNTSSLILLTGPASILMSIFFINKDNYYWIKEVVVLYIITCILFIKVSYLF